MGMRINSITTMGNAEDNAVMLVRYPECYVVIEGTWTTYNHTFKSPIVYGTNGALVGDYKTGSVQFYHTDGSVEDIEPDKMPEELKNIACAYVHHMDTGEQVYYTASLSSISTHGNSRCRCHSADSGKMELVNNIHWQIG